MTLLMYIFELHLIFSCTPWSISNMKNTHTKKKHHKQTNPKHQLRDQEILCKSDSTLFPCHILQINEMSSFWQCTKPSFTPGENHDLKKTHHFFMSVFPHIDSIYLQWRRRRVSYGRSWLTSCFGCHKTILAKCIPVGWHPQWRAALKVPLWMQRDSWLCMNYFPHTDKIFF